MAEKISIVIPCYNEEKFIAGCLQSIVNQSFGIQNIAIYVVDGMSTDQSRTLIKDFSSRYPQIQLVDNREKFTPQALNAGIQLANTPFVMILGAHSELREDYFEVAFELLGKKPEIDCLGGMIENIYENQKGENIGLAMSSSFGVGNAHFRTGNASGFVDTVAFGIYKAKVFEEIGLFDEDLVRNQDDDFNYRLTSNGFRIFLSDKMRVKYFVRANYSNLFKQYYQYGYWKVYVNKKHKTITTLRQVVPMLFVLFLCSSIIAAAFEIYAIIWLFLFVLYLTLGSFFAMKRTNNIGRILNVQMAFFLLHFSYGLGYLKGIFDFFILNLKPSQNLKTSSR